MGENITNENINSDKDVPAIYLAWQISASLPSSSLHWPHWQHHQRLSWPLNESKRGFSKFHNYSIQQHEILLILLNIYQDIGITFFDESAFHVIERMTINLVKVSLCHKNILHDYMSNKAPNILFLPSDFWPGCRSCIWRDLWCH